MDNDKAFAIYAFALVGGVLLAITLAVTGGVASLPGIAFIVEHVGLGLVVRATYKSFDGSNPVVDFLEFYGWKTAPEGARQMPQGFAAAA
jgi:hypothetical protein